MFLFNQESIVSFDIKKILIKTSFSKQFTSESKQRRKMVVHDIGVTLTWITMAFDNLNR